jgi:hypothetical protein
MIQRSNSRNRIANQPGGVLRILRLMGVWNVVTACRGFRQVFNDAMDVSGPGSENQVGTQIDDLATGLRIG